MYSVHSCQVLRIVHDFNWYYGIGNRWGACTYAVACIELQWEDCCQTLVEAAALVRLVILTYSSSTSRYPISPTAAFAFFDKGNVKLVHIIM